MRCPYCTNADLSLLEALDSCAFVVFCTVCSKTHLNHSYKDVRTVPRVNGPEHMYAITERISRKCGVLVVEES